MRRDGLWRITPSRLACGFAVAAITAGVVVLHHHFTELFPETFFLAMVAGMVTVRDTRNKAGRRLRESERKLLENQRTAFALLGRKLSAASTPVEAARIIIDSASTLFEWDAGYVHLYSPADDRVIPVLTIDRIEGERREIAPTAAYYESGPLMKSVLADGPRLLAREGKTVPLCRFGDMDRPSETLMFVPIRSSGNPVGILSIQSYTSNAYGLEDLKLLETFADYCGGALERIRTADALQESERKLRLIANNTSDVIFAFDMDGGIFYANPAVKKLTGYTFEEIQQRGFINWIHSDDQDRMLTLWGKLFEGQGYSDVEFRLVTKDGEVKWCSSSWGPLYDAQHRQIGVQGHERDVTERRLLERALLESAAREQRRIGYALHDGLGQVLTGLALKARTLQDIVAGSPEAAALAKRILELVNYSIRQTRSLARGLDPVHLTGEDLPATLHGLAAQSSELLQVECECAVECPALTLKPGIAPSLYCIAQEAIHNAARRGQAKHIEVRLSLEGTDLCLSIEDDGVGFDPKLSKTQGMGLRIMRARAESIGATLAVESEPGSGATVRCRVPLRLRRALERTTAGPAILPPESPS
jgi:PAS domain S-box-containing protein